MAQAFLRDRKAPSLKVRVTPSGAKAFVFERKLNGRTLRRTIGAVGDWPIERARAEARRLGVIVDSGEDPRDIARQRQLEREAEAEQAREEARRRVITGLDAWDQYVREGAAIGFTKRGKWSPRHHQDHLDLASVGGIPKKRGKGVTAAGPLRELLQLPLYQISADEIQAWLKVQNETRPTRAALAFRLLRGFLNWCATQPSLSQIANPSAHTIPAVRRLVANGKPHSDSLQREQLAAWFNAVREDPNQIARVFLQVLLLTGARKGEIASLQWDDVDLQHGSLTIRDKVETSRVIPCTPYVINLLRKLPKRGPWVFGDGDSAPNIARNATYNHRRALLRAGLPHVTLHGLRRSFVSLSEWMVECPVGVIAQIVGHKPSAVQEKHYRVRPLSLLREWHSRIEKWMLLEAGIAFTPSDESHALKLVA